MTEQINSQVTHDLNAGGEVGKELLDRKTLERRLHLWFFRDLSDVQRLGLFKLCGYPVDEMPTHAIQQLSLQHLVDALSRRSSAEAEVRVKSLEWDGRGATRPWPAWYFLNEAKGLGWRYHYGSDAPYLPTEADAKAAAQSDFDHRILSTLSPSPSIRAEPDFYAVWSGTMHIGTWSEKDHAEQAVREVEGATIIPLFASPQSPYPGGEGTRYFIEHDGFVGTVIGRYTRLDGKTGVVMQQDGTNIVHVYGTKWLKPADQTSPATEHQEVGDPLRGAFRNVDDSDWSHLFAVMPDTGRGRFWKAVFTEARAALSTGGKA